jgi:DNA polymerase-3 subunit beta
MKVLCDRAVLSEAFQTAQGVVSPRSPKPALQCVRIEATKKALNLLATDLEVGVRISLTSGLEVGEPGVALLSAERVGAILKELSCDKVSIKSTDRKAQIEADGSSFTILGDDPADFPTVPEFEADGATEIEAAKLLGMIHKTIFAAAREAARYALNGVLWEVRGKEIRLVATDGHRLAVGKGECKGGKSSGQVSAIVPTKAMHLIERALAGQETAQVQVGEKQILVKAGNTVIYSRLVDGHFPKYEDVIPQDCDKKVELKTAEFLTAMRQASVLTNEESRGVRVEFKKGECILSSRAPEMGEARITLKAALESADKDFEIAFNPFFVIDVLKVIEAETFTLQLKSANKPGLIREGAQYTHVIMPVNIP